MTDNQLKPTQADRDAAFNLARIMEPGATDWHHNILNGHLDGHSYVQAFARHRLSQSGNAERESGAGKHMSVEMAALFGEISKLTRLRIEHDEALRTGAGISAIEAAANKVDEIIDAIPALMPAFYAADRASASGAGIEQETPSTGGVA